MKRAAAHWMEIFRVPPPPPSWGAARLSHLSAAVPFLQSMGHEMALAVSCDTDREKPISGPAL